MCGMPMRSGSTPGTPSNRASAACLLRPPSANRYLRGTQITDLNGNVQFRTVFPSWYGGRTPHVHFKVFVGGNEVVASQIFFPDEITKEVFAQWDPYRAHVAKRKVFNTNDPIPQGVSSEVARTGKSYSAKAILVVERG